MPLWLRSLTWRVGLRLIQVARSLLVVVSVSSANARKKGAVGVGTPDVSQSTASLSSSCLFFVGWYAFPVFGSMKKHYFQHIFV